MQVIIPRTGTYMMRVAQHSGNGGGVAEVESNNSLGSAQDVDDPNRFSLNINNTINDQTGSTTTTSTGVGAVKISETWPHITISGTGDGTFDYYSFTAQAGKTGIFDIDGAFNANTGLNVRTELYLYDPRTGELLANSEGLGFSDIGSGSANDPLIQYKFLKDGTYVIGVARYDSVGHPGSISGFPLIAGDRYTLNVTLEGHGADNLPVTAGQFYTLNVSIANHALSQGRTDDFNIDQNGVAGGLEFQFFANLDNQFVNLGDSNTQRYQGSVQISQNKITDSLTTGILVNDTVRLGNGQPVGGVVLSLPTPNDDRLTRGVKISNNVIAGFGDAGIDLEGDGGAGNVSQAAVPFHRVINNTVYGGETPTGTGIRINNSSPTLINNIVANTNKAIELVGGAGNPSSTTVVSHGLYQNNGANDLPGGSAVNYPSGLPLFVDPKTNNFYLADVAPGVPGAIDSARDGFEDRPEISQVAASIGIPVSNLIAPPIDRFGQQRIDDPNIQNTGQGNKVFYDRGAVEHVDFKKPTSALIAPEDNSDPLKPIDPNKDLDSRADHVRLVNQTVRQFIVGLTDVGIGVDDFSVFQDLNGDGIDELSNVKLLRKPDGGSSYQLLEDQNDYLLRYNTNTKQITFDAASGVFPIGDYIVVLNTGQPISLINGQLQTDSSIPGFAQGLLFPTTNPPIRDLAGNSLAPNLIDGTTRFEIELQPAPTLTINDVSVLEGNTGDQTPVQLQVTLSADVGRVVSVDFAVEQSTGPDAATEGVDYTSTITQGTLTFDTSDPNNRIVHNADGSLTLTIPIYTTAGILDPNNEILVIGDNLAERSEQFFVRLSNPVGANINDGLGVVTINDDDLKIGVSPAQISEGDSGQKNMVFTASLLDVNGSPIDPANLPDFDVTFDYDTLAGTATEGLDYLPAMGTATILAGTTSTTFSVPVLGDLAQEGNETFFVDLKNANGAAFVNPNNPSGAGLATSQALGTIKDDDPKFSISDASVLEGDQGSKTVTFTVTASATPLPLSSAVTVNYRTQDLSATSTGSGPGDGDYDAATGTLTFRPIDSNQNLDSAGFSLGLNSNIQDSTTVPHLSINGAGNGQFTYYSFTVQSAGERGIFDIDGANFDSALFLYDSNGTLVDSNDNSPPNSGDDGLQTHPFIDHTFAAAGTYVIGVARTGSTGSQDGITGNPVLAGDLYRLQVSLGNHPLGTGPAVINQTDPGPLTKTVSVTVNSDRVSEGDEQFALVLENPTDGEIYAVNEIEPNQGNNSLRTAQSLDSASFTLTANTNINNSTTVPHVSINGTGDGSFDYYSFTVAAGDTATFDIDGANFDSQIFLYDPVTGNLLDQNDDELTLDAGSLTTSDSFLQHTFATGGTYVIGVARSGSTGAAGGITGVAPQIGDVYKLHLSLTNHAVGTGSSQVTEIDAVQNVDDAPFGLGNDATIQNSTTIPHLTINGTGDGTFDYYSFTVGDNTTATFDIDEANFDTNLFIYDPLTGNLVDPMHKTMMAACSIPAAQARAIRTCNIPSLPAALTLWAWEPPLPPEATAGSPARRRKSAMPTN